MHHIERYDRLHDLYRRTEAMPGNFAPFLGTSCGGCGRPVDVDGNDPDAVAFGWRAADQGHATDFVLCTTCSGDADPDRLPTLREVRRDRGLSQADLARAAGVSTATVSRIEGGSRSPSLNTLTRLCRVLDVRVEDVAWPGT